MEQGVVYSYLTSYVQNSVSVDYRPKHKVSSYKIKEHRVFWQKNISQNLLKVIFNHKPLSRSKRTNTLDFIKILKNSVDEKHTNKRLKRHKP